jgi:hypothetical protein
MKKFLSLLFAFSCLAFSEMRGQVTKFAFYNPSIGFIEQELSSTNGVHFTLSGIVIAPLQNDNTLGFFQYSGFDKFIYNFPAGTATDYNGVFYPYEIPPGNYVVQFNKLTQEFSFTGGTYRTFDECGIGVGSCNKLSVYLSSSFSSFQWKRNGVAISGATNSEYVHPSNLPDGEYVYTCDAFSIDSAAVISSNSISISNSISPIAMVQNANDFCSNRQLSATINQPGSDWIFQWKKDGQAISGATQSTYNAPPQQQNASYSCLASCPNNNASKESNPVSVPGSSSVIVAVNFQNASDYCSNRQFKVSINSPDSGWLFQWKKGGQVIPGATDSLYNSPPQQQNTTFSCVATCSNNNASKESNAVAVPGCFGDSTSGINYLLVQNVTTTGNNASNKTIQVQFDLSWGNTWWDDINWDAAWVFMKYKTASGEWKHAKINPAGYDHGQGSPNIIQPTADKMGAFVRLGLKGQGNFNAEGMQLQWNYGLDGLSSVNGLEVKVFATEMVYQPQGDFTVSKFRINTKVENIYHPDTLFDFNLFAKGNNTPVINSRLTPKLSAYGISGIRIKGDAGLDLDSNGTIDNTTYPTGYYPFYLFKYEMSEQAYADFLNCLSPAQVNNLGIAGTTITQNQGQYFAAAPNRACKGANAQRCLAYADWSGLRPASFLELQKAYNGPNSPNNPFFNFDNNTGIYGNIPKQSVSPYSGINGGIPFDASGKNGRGIYGAKDLIGNVWEPLIGLNATEFIPNHGDGAINIGGNHNQNGWSESQLKWGNFSHNNAVRPQYNLECEICYLTVDGFPISNIQCYGEWGFRLCRSAE